MRFAIFTSLLLPVSGITALATPFEITESDSLPLALVELINNSTSSPGSSESSLLALEHLEHRLSLLDPATATPSDLSAIFRGQALFCHSHPGSPMVGDIHCAANRLIEERGDSRCWQVNKSLCTRYGTCGKARIETCGLKGKGVMCSTLAWAAKHIANTCAIVGNGGAKRSMGYYWFEVRQVGAGVHGA